jgi:hypothetical protein
MNRSIFVFCILIIVTRSYAQQDRYGNPIFNSQVISDEKVDNFRLLAGYYTIANNISNKKSSVYRSSAPSLTDYLAFSRELPSYFFVVFKGETARFLIGPIPKVEGNKTKLFYRIMNLSTNKSAEVPCQVFGEISEKRVEELIRLQVDTTAKVLTTPNGKLYLFQGIAYRIQPYEQLKADVISMARELLDMETHPAQVGK